MGGTILIVDDVATNRIVLKVKLAAACYDTLQAEDGAGALLLARDALPDLILLDLNLPDMTGISVCRQLKSDPATRDIPVVMITAFRDPTARLEALEAGVDEFLSKPLDEMILLARLRSLLRAREAAEELRLRDSTSRELGFAETALTYEVPGLIGLVAARRDQALAWRRELTPHLAHRIVILGREEALGELPAVETPDVFVIATDLGQPGEGLRLMSDLRSRPNTRHSAICMMLAETPRETAAMALDLGASDLLWPHLDPRETALRLATQLRRKRDSDRLRASVRDGLRLALIDPLTGLYNRRYALPHLARMAERAAQTGRHYAVMVLDLDRFKSVNDSWGHAAGDAVLVEVAARLRANMRSVDLLARIGGEEFLVAMPDTSLPMARIAAERLCRVFEDHAMSLPGNAPPITVTLSIGLALGGGPEGGNLASVHRVIDSADHALLAAKAEGRNQVTVSRSAA